MGTSWEFVFALASETSRPICLFAHPARRRFCANATTTITTRTTKMQILQLGGAQVHVGGKSQSAAGPKVARHANKSMAKSTRAKARKHNSDD